VFTGLLNYDGFNGSASLRVCYSGASALPAAILRRWADRTGAPIYEGYGQTEAGPILTYNSPLFPMKPGRVGRPLPGTEVEVVDTASGAILPTGEPGEIRARGPQMMTGYWQRPEETAAALRDGWLYTGDIGAFDADGDLVILDRRKDMVIVGGYNVYPREVEDVLLTHPAVTEAAVTVDALAAHCRANLAAYKVPVVLRLVPGIPKTPVGKIDKTALRRAQVV
jgi:long-chain acyl-CoA synthetase